MDHRLTEAERAQLDRDGYVLREAAFDAGEIEAIKEACEALVTRLAAGRTGNRVTVGSYTFEPDLLTDVTIKWEADTDVVHGLEPFAHLSPELEKWAYDPRFTEPMIDLVGDSSPTLFTEKLNLKRPHHGGANPLHQDFPYWQFADDPARIATAMLFLDESTVENGTLRVVPGSHRDGQWRNRTNGDMFGNLEIDPTLDDDRAVPLEVPAGSVVYFGAFLVHKSAKNTSDKDRRALLYSYQPAGFTHGRDLLRAVRERRRQAASSG